MNNSPVSMGRFKPALWVAAIVCICVSLLRVVVRPSEVYVSLHPFSEELDTWVTIDFTTGQEVSRSDNSSNGVNAWEAAWLKNALPVSKVVFALKCFGLAVGFAVCLAVGIVAIVIFLRRVDWLAVLGVAVGVLRWFLGLVASIVCAVAEQLCTYLARVGKNIMAAKGDLARKLIRTGGEFLIRKGALGRVFEWVEFVKNAGFEKLDNFLAWIEERLEPVKRYLIGRPIQISEVGMVPWGEPISILEGHSTLPGEKVTPPKSLSIRHTSLPQNHKTPMPPDAVTEKAEYEDDGVWVEDSRPTVQSDVGPARPVAQEEIQEVVVPEVIWAFKRKPWSRQTIFTANSSKDIEGVPLYVYPMKGRWWVLQSLGKVIAGLKKILPRTRAIKVYRVTRPCRRVIVIPHSRRRTKKKASSAPHAMPPSPQPTIDQSISEARGQSEVFSSCDGKSMDLPAVLDEVRGSVEQVIVKEVQASIGSVVVEDFPASIEQVIVEKVQASVGPVVVEEVQAPVRPVIEEDVQASFEPVLVERRTQAFFQEEEVAQKVDQLTMAQAPGLAPTANIHELWTNIQGVGIATWPLSDVPKVEMNAADSGNVNEQVLEALPDTLRENLPEAGLAIEPLGGAPNAGMNITDPWGVPAQASIVPAVAEVLEGLHSQMFFEQQVDTPAVVPGDDNEQVEEANLDTFWGDLLEMGLVTEQLADASNVDVNVVDYWGVPATVEEVISLQQTITMEDETVVRPAVVEGPGESHSQVFLEQEGVAKQEDLQAMVLTQELAPLPQVNINELWGNLMAAGLVTESLGDAPSADMSVTDRAFSQQEGVIIETEPPAIALPHEPVQQVSIDDLWANLEVAGFAAEKQGSERAAEAAGLNSTHSQKPSPPYGNPIADLTRYSAPGFGNGGLASRTFAFPTREQTPTSSQPVGGKTEAAGPVSLGGLVVPAFLFGDEYDMTPEVAPPVADTFNFAPPGQQRWGAPPTVPPTWGNASLFGNSPVPMPAQGSVRHCVVPGFRSGRFHGDNGREGPSAELVEKSSGSETDEDQKIYWDDSMPQELRTSQGHQLRAPKVQTSKASNSLLADSGSEVTDFSESELYELFNKECEYNDEAKKDEQDPDKGDDEDSEEEWDDGSSDEIKWGDIIPARLYTTTYGRAGFCGAGTGGGESDSDEIKWADSMPAHFRTPGYGRVSVPNKEVDKEKPDSDFQSELETNYDSDSDSELKTESEACSDSGSEPETEPETHYDSDSNSELRTQYDSDSEPEAESETHSDSFPDPNKSRWASDSDSDEVKWADSMPDHFRIPGYCRVSVPNKKVNKEKPESESESESETHSDSDYEPESESENSDSDSELKTETHSDSGSEPETEPESESETHSNSGSVSDSESHSDEIKWADSMPDRFRAPGYGVPVKEKELPAHLVSSAEWATKVFRHFEDPNFAAKRTPDKEEGFNGGEQSEEFNDVSYYGMDEDEEEFEWDSSMTGYLPPLRKPGGVNGGAGGGIEEELSPLILEALTREAEAYHRVVEAERRKSEAERMRKRSLDKFRSE